MEFENQYQDNSNDDNSKWYIELVDANKFIILFVMSLGLYSIWWMYKVWKFFQQKEEPNMMPAARAIFGIFWVYPLFERIQDYAKENGYESKYNSSFLFVGYVIMNLSSRLPDPIGLVAIFAFILMIPPLRAYNFAVMNSDYYNGEEVARYSAGQMAVVAIGLLLWSTIFLGMVSNESI